MNDDFNRLMNMASTIVMEGMSQLEVGSTGAFMLIIADGSKVYISTDVDQGRLMEFAIWATENMDGLNTTSVGGMQ